MAKTLRQLLTEATPTVVLSLWTVGLIALWSVAFGPSGLQSALAPVAALAAIAGGTRAAIKTMSGMPLMA